MGRLFFLKDLFAALKAGPLLYILSTAALVSIEPAAVDACVALSVKRALWPPCDGGARLLACRKA